MSAVVAFGEMLLRLKSPGAERLFQSPGLEATFGGTEANVLVSLAQFGNETRFVSAVPSNPVGDACVGSLRAFGVDVTSVRRAGDRLGLYYLEAGVGQRPSRVTYDRVGSAFATVAPSDWDWNAILADGDWFHVSGVTPALSEWAAQAAINGARAARSEGITVSCDYNHRMNLWRYGRPAPEVMRELIAEADVCVASVEECRALVGGAEDNGVAASGHHVLGQEMLRAFPHLGRLVITLRESKSASHGGWGAMLVTRAGFQESRRYELAHIADRVGSGDAFVAGLIHGLRSFGDDQRALEFAAAAACLKHSIPGDFNRVGVAEVEALMSGDVGGRVAR